MASRKIVSQSNDSTQGFPSLGLPVTAELSEDKEFDGHILKAGMKDPEFVPEIEAIQLCVIGERMYYSVHEKYTAEILTPTAENDYVIEKKLDGNFVYTVLDQNINIKDKYKQDPTYLKWLGLPAYDEETHKTCLNAEASVSKEEREAADARWEAHLAQVEADKAADEARKAEFEAARLASKESGTPVPPTENNEGA
jgi:hypothetical protein